MQFPLEEPDDNMRLSKVEDVSRVAVGVLWVGIGVPSMLVVSVSKRWLAFQCPMVMLLDMGPV